MDILADPKAREVMLPVIHQTMEVFSHEEQGGGSEAAKEAVTEDMTVAMMNYMPLRGAFSFGMGGLTREKLLELIEKLNAAE